MPFDLSSSLGLMIGAILYGLLHGLTPHGHSWLVLLPFALGGMKERGMLRIAIAYGLGMVVAAAGAGALLGLIMKYIPEAWHHGTELTIGAALAVAGFVFLIRPLSVHHAIDHLCNEGCHSGEEKALLRTGTFGAMFMLGVMSMLIPCPTNAWILVSIPTVERSPLATSALFALFALASAISIGFIAVAMVRARNLVALLEQRGFRLLIWRLSGLIILGVGVWLFWLGLHPHGH